MTECTDMATIVEGYLGFRRKLGFNTNNEGKKLFNFIRYADRIGHQGPITSELVVRWSKYPQETNPGRHAQRLAVIRRFAKYWALFDPGVEVPPDGLLGPCSYRRRSPHIYSKEEISQLLKAAAKLSPYYGLRPSTYVTLFGLLACTGLRISEALQLTHKEHLEVYGDNSLRLSGNCETSDPSTFSWGYGNRSCSIRIPNQVIQSQCGYFEDRRPASDADPYQVTSILFKTCCL